MAESYKYKLDFTLFKTTSPTTTASKETSDNASNAENKTTENNTSKPIISDANQKKAKADFSLSLTESGTTSSVEATIDKCACNLIPVNIKFEKKIFQPGYINVCIQVRRVDTKGSWPSLQKVMAYFAKATIDFQMMGKDVAKDYLVFKVEPVFNQKALYVTLHIYSPDYWMTLSEYSKSFTAKKLGDNILINEAKNFGFKKNDNIDCSDLQLLTFKEDGKNEEFIQPYLVQYNESFYDFMKRCANRNGEFFYYEEGMLRLGVKPVRKEDSNGVLLPLTKYKSVTLQNILEDEHLQVTDIMSDYTNTVIDKPSDAKKDASKTEVNYNLQYADNEFMAPIKKNTADSMAMEYGTFGIILTRWVGKILGLANFYDITGVGIEEAQLAITAAAVKEQRNNKYNKTFFEDAKYNDKQWFGTKGDSDACEFATSTNSSRLNPLNYKSVSDLFYATVRKNEQKAASQMLKVDLGTSLETYLLGSVFAFGDNSYITTAASGFFQSSEDPKTGNLFWDQGQQMEALPLINKIPFPFPLSEPVRTCKPQTAIVKDNNDPLNLGRVRVQYPWEKGDKSPWLRVVSPMAFKGGGICMLPQKGEEVMIDYVGGNMERPFVSGGVFNSESPTNEKLSTHNVIMSSPNGHYIRMSTPKDAGKFASSFFPAAKLIKGFMPTVPWGELKGDDRGIVGAIEMGDKFGMVGITLSTDDRAISIKSPLGTVNISAFNGISISAPNGKVSITGKDVEIAAGNKLTLTSGATIKNDLDNADKSFLQQVGSAALKKAGKYLDMSILRDIFETFVRPIDGTLTIKSYRYLRLEAGRGKTSYHFGHFGKVSNKADVSDDVEKKKQQLMIIDTLHVALERLDETIDKYVELRNLVVWSMKYYNDLVEYYQYADNLSDQGKVDNMAKSANQNDAFNDKIYKDKVIPKNDITEAARALFTNIRNFVKLMVNLDKAEVTSMKLEEPQNNAKADIFFFQAANEGIKAIKTKLQEMLPARGSQDPKFFFKNVIDKKDAQFQKNYHILQRQLLYNIIKKMKSLNLIEYKAKGDVLASEDAPAINDFTDDAAWKDFIARLKWKESSENALLTFIKDSTGFSAFTKDSKSEKLVWGSEQQGQILMSDSATHTSYITNGTLVSKPNEEASTIKEYLSKF